MGAVKAAATMVECHYCGQLVMFDACASIPLANSPDDFDEVPVCDQCANDYAEMCQDDPDYEEEESGQQTKPEESNGLDGQLEFEVARGSTTSSVRST